MLSLSRQMISALETETSLPSLDTLDKIRELFNVDIFLFLHVEIDFYKKDSNKVQKKTIKDFFEYKKYYFFLIGSLLSIFLIISLVLIAYFL